MTLTVRDLVKASRGQLVSGYPATRCERISIDTRTLKPGDVFFALEGPRHDGHRFLRAAAEKGAAAIVLHRLDPDMTLGSRNIPDLIQVPDTLTALQETGRYVRSKIKKTVVIGLTGSNGKTTTKEMLASILRRAGKTLATRGNLNNHIGLPIVLTELEPDDQYAVIEMGTSKKGDMDLLVDLSRPTVGLITNVGKDHLEFLGTPEGVLDVNRKLFDALPKNGIAVINLEDPLLKSFAGKLPCTTVTYGRVPEADVRADSIVPSSSTVQFSLLLGKEAVPVTLNVVGEVQVLNAMAAAAVAYALKISSKQIVEGLESFKAVPMRMQAATRPDGTTIVNDAYNANPSSMRASIDSFCRSYPDRPRWLVLGDMRELGPIARQEHDDLGRWIAQQPVDRVFLYGRDSRFIQQGLMTEGRGSLVERYRKKRYLIESLNRSLQGPSKPAILFKASRSLKLEQVSHALLPLPT